MKLSAGPCATKAVWLALFALRCFFRPSLGPLPRAGESAPGPVPWWPTPRLSAATRIRSLKAGNGFIMALIGPRSREERRDRLWHPIGRQYGRLRGMTIPTPMLSGLSSGSGGMEEGADHQARSVLLSGSGDTPAARTSSAHGTTGYECFAGCRNDGSSACADCPLGGTAGEVHLSGHEARHRVWA